ncbi:hypothetical protein JOD97_003358 [Duganella sp. 1411]|uniref:hypothetical protein n=1 Tax=Duganella sp. 1411 TaxID=2806572 RepID=UPI001AE2372E|nr:hypothetical protein [Duganella sp. 1411]MBP1205316.1 hypothetical protein [Duganella sp. 1411]
MATATKDENQELFEETIRSLEAQLANAGAHLTIDAAARATYAREIKRMADRLRNEAFTGKITWAQAAQQAQQTRNAVMTIIRSRSTSVGRAVAQRIKAQGYTLNELVARQTARMYGPGANFARLSASQKNIVYASIVSSAGKSNPAVTQAMSRLSFAGRGVIFVSLGLSIYNVTTATNKVAAVGKEVAINGAGIAGGMAGGALAGLACGPGAPVCVTVGAFIGGALAAFGVSSLW